MIKVREKEIQFEAELKTLDRLRLRAIFYFFKLTLNCLNKRRGVKTCQINFPR